MQNYTEISLDDGLSDSLAMILDNDKTALSCSSGTAFPTANVQIGQLCFRTDENKLYQTKDGKTWVEVGDLSKSFTAHKDELTAQGIQKSMLNKFGILREGFERFEQHGPSVVGTLAIRMPLRRSTTMMNMKVRGMHYATDKTVWELDLGAYAYSTGWVNTVANSISNLPWGNSVRFAEDDTYAYILLGTTATAWSYPRVWIEEVMVSISPTPTQLDPSNYVLMLLTDESALTVQANTTVTAKATEVEDGVYASTAQTISGAKTFSGVTKVTNATDSSSTASGGLVVSGGLGVAKQLRVGGTTTLGGALNVSGATAFTGATTHNGGIVATTGKFNDLSDSTSTTTGALQTLGGLGVDKNANIGGSASVGGTLSVGGKVTAGSVDSTGAIKVADTTDSTSQTTGALIVSGGAGFGGKVYASTFVGALTGNASTATQLATARAINGVNFNGTANISVPALVSAVPTNADLNNYQTPGFYSCIASATAATMKNCPTAIAFSLLVEKHAGVRQTVTEYTTSDYKIYVRNMYAGAWGEWSRIYTTHDAPTEVSGNAGTATKLATARTISVSGDATGSASFDGSANSAISLTLANSGATAGTYKSVTVDAKGRVTAGATVVTSLISSTAATGTTNVATTNTNTYLNIVENVGGALSSVGSSTQVTGAGTVTVTSDAAGKLTITGAQSITGNAATATKLATARTINGVSFDGTANITVADSTKIAKGEYGLGLVEGQTAISLDSTAIDAAASWYSGTARYSDPKLPGTYGHLLRLGGGTTNTNGGWFNDLAFSTSGIVSSRWKTNDATWSDWITHITSGNIGSQSVASAATLTTARTIGGVSFNGSANINLPGVNTTGNQSTTGNAATATVLQTARTINGVSFNGSANITVADSTKLPLAGGTLTGQLTLKAPTVSTTIAGLGTGALAPIKANSINVGTTFGYVPVLAAQNQSSSGYLANVSWGMYRPASDWGGSGAFISMGGSDSAPTEAFHFILGGEISHTSGSVTLKGNADTATKLATARTIGGVSFDGTANINLPGVNVAGNQSTTGNAATATKLATARTIGGVSFDGTANINLPGVNTTGTQNTTGSAATLTTARTINGTSFNGSANITTANWGTARTITIGSTGKSVNGSANVAWTLAEIGAAAASHTHAYLSTAGGTLSGNLSVTGSITATGNVTAYSDKRIKKNIKNIGDALAKVNQLNGVTFDRKDTGESQTGLLAQEVEAVLPQAVSRCAPSAKAKKFTKGEDILAVNYGSLVGLLVESIKEIDEKLKAQQELIDKQAKLIENLLARSKS